MFVSNNQISGRQAMRLLTFDLLGYSALMIPAQLAWEAGRDGIFSLILGILFGFFYLWILKVVLFKMTGSYSDYLTMICGKFLGGLLKIGYIIYFLVLSGRVASIFAELVVKELLKQQFHLILLILLVLAFYGVIGGIEGRARVYEILFWIVLIPLLGMMLFTIPAVDTDYWQPIFSATKAGVLKGGYQTFVSCSILFLVPFLAEYVKKRENLSRCGLGALFLTGGILCLLYLMLLGLFGSEALATIEYPVVTMMSRVQITGGFLKRVDAIMFGIWFFTLYALLNSLIFFGGRLWMDFVRPLVGRLSIEKTGDAGKVGDTEKVTARICMLLQSVFVFILADWFYQSQGAKEAGDAFFWYVGTPFVVLVPVFLLALRAKALQKVIRCLFLFCCLQFVGCGATEVENREFPVLLEVKDEENFSKEWLNSLQEGNKQIDYNHLKVVLVSKDFLENDAAMSEMLSVLKQDKDVPLNAYVVTTEDMENFKTVEESLEEPLGNYIEQLLENTGEIKKETFPTIGMLYQEKENRLETLFIPCVSVVEEEPRITSYEAYKRGRAVGMVETDVALLAFFIANQLEEYTLQLGVNNFIRLSNIENEIQFEEHIKDSGLITKRVQVQVTCDGEVIQEKVSGDDTEVTNWLKMQMSEYMSAKSAEALTRGIDLTNSKKKLGGSMRNWYERYLDAPEDYEKDIEVVFDVKVHWVE